MHREISIHRVNVVILRLSEWLVAVHRVEEMEVVHGRVIFLYDRPFKHSQFFNGRDLIPIQRFLESASVIA